MPSRMNSNPVANQIRWRMLAELYRRAFARRSILAFTLYTFPAYVISKHNILISQYIDRWVSGEIQNLMIFTPPRHGKTELVSRRLVAYLAGKCPGDAILPTSYAGDLAAKNSRHAKAIIESQEYKALFPEVEFSGSKNTVEEWETTQGTEFKCAGVGGGITGRGFRWGIIDDPVKDRKEAESKTVRDSIWDWWTSTFFSRINPDGGQILLIMTPWHKDDLAGRLIKQNREGAGIPWTILKLPAVAKKNDPFRMPGEALWPTKFPLHRLQKIKETIGIYDWSALWMCDPVPPEGQKIRRDWFEVVDEAPEDCEWVRFYDLAVSIKTSADHVASFALGRRGGLYYLKNMIFGRWEWPQTRKIIISNAKIDGYDCVIGIETGGQQEGFLQDLKSDERLADYIIKGVSPDADKLTRALPWIAKAEAGKVKLVNGKWIPTFLDIAEDFTGHDDAIDDPIDAVSGGYKMHNPRVTVQARRV